MKVTKGDKYERPRVSHQGIEIWRYPKLGDMCESIHIDFGSTQIVFEGRDALRLRQFLNREKNK